MTSILSTFHPFLTLPNKTLKLCRYLFRAFDKIGCYRKKGAFFALLIGTFLNRKKGTFFALLKRSLQTEKKVPFSRFKVLFGKVRNG